MKPRTMGLFDRLLTTARANVNYWVGQQEDPEKVLETFMRTMQADLVSNRQAVAQAIATSRRTDRQAQNAHTQATAWFDRAQTALEHGDETLARQALTRRVSYQSLEQQLKEQYNQQTLLISQLKQTLITLEQKFLQLRTEKDIYLARARAAQASIQIYEMLDRTGSSEAIRAFEQVRDRVDHLEAQAEVAAELNASSLDQRFASLETQADIESTLTQLKTQLGSNRRSPR
ncbi:MAG: PspA/IM30 family protein [Alkalinema sp. RU_4_3]|nr:PspA/IM30 family protein [Alkalinema sp. RU_4_3]